MFQHTDLRLLRSDKALTSYKFELLASNLIVTSRSIADKAALFRSCCLVLAMGLRELLLYDPASSKLAVSVLRDQAVLAV